MIWILMLCSVMSSSGEACTNVASFQTQKACENAGKTRPQYHSEYYKCEISRLHRW